MINHLKNKKLFYRFILIETIKIKYKNTLFLKK